MAPELTKVFEALGTAQGRAQVARLALLIERGDVDGLLVAVGLNPAVFRACAAGRAA